MAQYDAAEIEQAALEKLYLNAWRSATFQAVSGAFRLREASEKGRQGSPGHDEHHGLQRLLHGLGWQGQRSTAQRPRG